MELPRLRGAFLPIPPERIDQADPKHHDRREECHEGHVLLVNECVAEKDRLGLEEQHSSQGHGRPGKTQGKRIQGNQRQLEGEEVHEMTAVGEDPPWHGAAEELASLEPYHEVKGTFVFTGGVEEGCLWMFIRK
jgi:hypothetical protein